MDSTAIENIKRDVEEAAKELLGEKLIKVILYGSYARGDFDEESDIDFALISSIPEKEISSFTDEIGEIISDLSIKHGILIIPIIVSTDTFNTYKNTLPFYMNLINEGVGL